LQGKKLALVANHTSLLPDGTHMVDAFIQEGLDVVKVFAPEHGFRGTADAGELVESGVDKKTGLMVLSLHGKHKKPTAKQLEDVDLVVFDIQDVGTRFYTYISTMSYVMEACAESNVPFMVLDRPNPNGWYVDGPVLESAHSSFIGMHEIPIVHGMSIGEYAQMVNGEGWLKNGVKVDLTVVPCEGYERSMRWDETGMDWIPPSPNLASEYSAYLYAAICWFEPTPLSLGRGTDSAFTVLGAPWFKPEVFFTARQTESLGRLPGGLGAEITSFTPRSLPGKSTYPKFQDKACEGLVFRDRVDGKSLFITGLSLLAEAYRQHQAEGMKGFFTKGFERWPGNTELKAQIEAGTPAEEIYASWQDDVEAFKTMRKPYLIYE
ncbi:MAG: DUF1343 domain-containing protein, partial [Bacteroidota bacterium]